MPTAHRPYLHALVVAASLALAVPAASALDVEQCHADHAAFLDALAHNREQRLAAAGDSLADAADEAQRARILQEREAAWEHEEQMRGLAAQNLRDCLRHVDGLRAGG